MFVVRDEDIREEGREEIEEKYEDHNPHGIERCVEVFRMLDIFFARDKSYNIRAIYEKKTSDTDSKYQKGFVGFCHVSQKNMIF